MNKKILIVSSTIVLSSLIATPISTLVYSVSKEKSKVNIQNSSDNEYKYLYKDKYYNSYDDIVEDVLRENSEIIFKDLYYGNVNDAIFDQESKRLNIAQMRKFDHKNPSRLLEAWINALGQHTRDFNEAKRSYINEGLVQYKYIDMFGNMFPTYSEANESNKKSTKFDEIAYYELKDEEGKDIKINPLNLEDVNEVKKIALNEISKGLAGTSAQSPFKLAFMEEKEEKKNELNEFSITESSDSSFFYSSFDNIVNKLFDVINISMKEWIENIKVDVRISLLNKNSHLTHNYYLEIENEYSGITDYIEVVKSINNYGNSYTNDKRDLIIKNVKLKDLHIFDSFLNTSYFYDENRNSDYLNIKNWIQKKGGKKRAREAEITFKSTIWDNKNEDIKVKILCSGSGDAGYGGVDIEIMKDGANLWLGKPQLYFATNVVEFDSNSIKDFNNNGFMDVFNKKLEEQSLGVNYKKHLENIINDIIGDNDNNLLQKVFDAYKKNTNSFKNINNIYTKPDKAKGKLNPFFENSETFFNKEQKNNINLKAVLKDNENKIIDYIKNYLKGIENVFEKQNQYIMYNGFPLFKIEIKNSNIKNEELLSIDKENSISSFYIKYYKNNINNLKNKVFEIKNVSSIDWKRKNKSNWYCEYINNKQTYITNEYFDSINSLRKTLLIRSDEKDYEPKGWKGSDKNYKETLINGIFGAINAYNKNILAMSNSSYNKFKESNSFVQPENILVLKNNRQENLKTIYAKILSQKEYSPDMFNPPMNSNKNLDKMANNEFSEKRIRELYHKIEPSKIIVVYDITGKVINPGIGLDGIANTSNDALYDSEKNILDNLYRTTIIKKDPNMSYYQNDDGTYTLINNKVNWVYSLKWENKTNYFTTYNDTKRYLKEMIKIDTIKIKI